MRTTKLALAFVGVTAALAVQAAGAAQPNPQTAAGASFITDTLAPGGVAPGPGYRFITDTLAPGGGAASTAGYRFTTDTLAPGGGVISEPAARGFAWRDATLGAAAAALSMLALLAAVRGFSVRRRVVTT